MMNQEDWYVIVERSTHADERLRPYGLGPFPNETEAEAAGNRDDGDIFALLTIDSKNDGYVADDCYWTTTPPADSIIISTLDEGILYA